MALESLNQFGPQRFREVLEAQLTPEALIDDPSKLPIGGKRGDSFRQGLEAFDDESRKRFDRLASLALERSERYGASILLAGDPEYPPNLWASNNPVPILYVRGNAAVLKHRTAIACVGSREIRAPYDKRQREFAAHAAAAGRVVVSGFALGADVIAHRAAVDAKGSTVCVMPCGLDRPFPPENRQLWAEFLEYDRAVFVSEFPFGMKAASLTLRKRNKTIVALARGVLIGQSALKGGAMNAFRFALEQKKPIATFEHDGTEATSGNRQIAEEENGTAFPSARQDDVGWDEWLARL